jgi:hypothetical protein
MGRPLLAAVVRLRAGRDQEKDKDVDMDKAMDSVGRMRVTMAKEQMLPR